MKNKKFTISLYSIIGAAVAFFLGYLVGRGYADTAEDEKEVIKWKTEYLPAVHDTIIEPQPYFVYKTDTVYSIMERTLEVDTMAILADFYKVKKYNMDFSTDSTGIFKVDIDVTKNSLANVVSEVRPIIRTKEVIRTVGKTKTLQFYGVIGSSVDLKTNKIQFGVNLRQKYLIGASGIRFDDKFGYTIDLGMNF